MSQEYGQASDEQDNINENIDENEQVQDEQQAEQPDPIRNLKGEFNRKIQNLTSQNQQILSALTALQQQQAHRREPEATETDLQDLMYSNPEKYAQIIEQRVTNSVNQRVNQSQQAQARINQVVTNMMEKFPEFKKTDSELSQRSIEIYDSFSDAEKSDQAAAYHRAMSEAVFELGAVPVSKRRPVERDDSGDDFSFSGNRSGGGMSNNNRRPNQKKSRVSQKTLAFAEAMGRDINDPEVRKRLEQAADRSNWTKYGGGKK